MSTASPRTLEELVNHQVRLWQIALQRGRSARPAPCIALSRLPGSAAAELGQEVAARLGFGFFGIEIVDLMAREGGTQRELVAGLDERVRTTIERYVVNAMRGGFDENRYHEQLVRTLATLGERGLAVILGRGSPFVLRAERTLRVLVVAPKPVRIERYAKTRNLDTADARAEIDRTEAARRAFNRHHFQVDPDDPEHYDIVVNTGTLSLGLAIDTVVETARRRFSIA